jgi:hypothetical protein
VVTYEKNAAFCPEKVVAKKDILVCAGQVFARTLLEKPEWIVLYCQIDPNRWDFVAYKDCHMCNSAMLDAKEGENKFTGYEKLADFVFQTGQDKALVKDPVEIKILKKLGLTQKCDRVTKIVTTPVLSSCQKSLQVVQPTMDNRMGQTAEPSVARSAAVHVSTTMSVSRP